MTLNPDLQDYVSQLATVRPEALANANKKMVIVGCGDYQPINHYRGTVSRFLCHFAANPRLTHIAKRTRGIMENYMRTPRESSTSYST